MTQEERRIKILQKRLRLLAEYLDRFSGSENIPSFKDFIKHKKVTYAEFIKDLPPGYQNVPASGYDNILEYAVALQELLNGQNNIIQMSADGDDLGAGLIKYEGGQYTKDDCGCGCGGDDKDCGQDGGNYSGSGGEQGGESPALAYMLDDSGGKFDDYMSFAASGSKICIKPMAPIIPERINPGMWRSYRNKVTAYNKCKAERAASGGYTLAEKAEHAFHANPIGPFTLGRVAFLKLISNNVFGFAQTYERMRKSPNQDAWNKTKKLFYRLGGDPKKLDSNVSVGHSKKPIFKPKGWRPKGATTSNGADGSFSADGEVWYNGEAYTAAGIAAIITAATGVISQMAPIIKSFKKDNGEPELDLDGTPDPNYNQGDVPEGSPDEDGGMLSNINWAIAAPVGIVLLIGIGFAIYKATK